eukprot:3711643-Rhodomonas_salina.1
MLGSETVCTSDASVSARIEATLACIEAILACIEAILACIEAILACIEASLACIEASKDHVHGGADLDFMIHKASGGLDGELNGILSEIQQN